MLVLTLRPGQVLVVNGHPVQMRQVGNRIRVAIDAPRDDLQVHIEDGPDRERQEPDARSKLRELFT